MSKGILQFPVKRISDEMRIICQSEVKPLEEGGLTSDLNK